MFIAIAVQAAIMCRFVTILNLVLSFTNLRFTLSVYLDNAKDRIISLPHCVLFVSSSVPIITVLSVGQ